MEQSTPLMLGPFALLDELGRGGMAQVWRAAYDCPGTGDDLNNGRGSQPDLAEQPASSLVALKVLTAEHARRASYLLAFKREVRAIASLDHPNILVVLDHGQISKASAAQADGQLIAGSPWLAMELASSGNLRSHRGKMAWPQLRKILLELLDALAHAHARGILHRDVKPANVLFGAWGDGIRLADFGVSLPLYGDDAAASMSTVVGTPAYMAPEQFEGRAYDFGPWTDLYGLGCLAFEMACGTKPYRTPKSFAVMSQAHLTWPLPELKPALAVPDGFEAWVHRLLQKDGRNRPQFAADAAEHLRALGEPADTASTTMVKPGIPATDASQHHSSSHATDVGSTVTTRGETRHKSTATWPPTPAISALSKSEAVTNASQLPTARRFADGPAKRGRHAHAARLVGAGLGLYGLRTIPFVARERERDELWQQLRAVNEQGSVEVALLVGSAGTGKSRLAQWLSEQAHEAGVAHHIRATHSPDAGVSNGLIPMMERLYRSTALPRPLVLRCVAKRHHAGSEPLTDSDIAALLSLLRPTETAQNFSPSIWLDAPDARYAVIARALVHAARERPIIVWLDDVHWGPDALNFVNYLLLSQPQQPVPALVVLTARQEELATRPIERELLANVEAHPAAKRYQIGPLPDAIRGPFIEEVLGLRGDLAARVRVRTAGNPSFAIQLVGDWVARGLLQPSRSGFHLVDDADVALPDDVYATWNGRVAKLLEQRPGQLRALQMAAILGRHVNDHEWQLACQKQNIAPTSDIAPMLRALVQELAEQGLAEIHESSAWSFVHGMLHESLERGVQDPLSDGEPNKWSQLHATAAEVLQERAQITGVEAPPERLGRHLLEAKRASAAIAPLLESMRAHLIHGELALAQVSVAWLDRAKRQANLNESDRTWIEALLLEAQMARQQGRIDAARHCLERAEPGARSGNHHDLLASILSEEAIVAYRAGDLDAALTRSQEGETLSASAKLEALVACCLEVRGRAYTDRGELAQAETCFSRSLNIYQKSDSQRGIASSQLGLGWVAMTQGQLPQAYRLINEARHGCDSADLRVLSGVCMNMLGEIERKRGKLAESQHCYREAVRRHQRCGALATSMIAELNLALVHIESEDFSTAESLAHAVQRSIQLSGARQFLSAAHLILSVCAAASDRWDHSRKHFDQAQTLLGDSGQVHDDLANLAEKTAHLARTAGHHAFATRAFSLAEQQWRRLGCGQEADRAKQGAALSRAAHQV